MGGFTFLPCAVPHLIKPINKSVQTAIDKITENNIMLMRVNPEQVLEEVEKSNKYEEHRK